MKKNHTILSLLFLPLIVGCLPQHPYYDRFLYHTQEFSDNMYDDTFYDAILPTVASTASIQLENYSTDQPLQDDPNGDSYAMQERLSNTFPQFKYGMESKLFDGILYCTDAQRLSKSRLQLRPEGMGFYFPRTLRSFDQIVLFMKAGADTNAGAEKIRDLTVHLSLFELTDDGIIHHRVSVDVNDLVPSNFPGYYEFNLPESFENILAFGFQYTILSPIPSIDLASKTGVFLYEVLFPNAQWA